MYFLWPGTEFSKMIFFLLMKLYVIIGKIYWENTGFVSFYWKVRYVVREPVILKKFYNLDVWHKILKGLWISKTCL